MIALKINIIQNCIKLKYIPQFDIQGGCFSFSILSHAASGLELVRVTVPQHHSPGEKAELFCDYNMGGEVLYSVKWYKDGHEFYRFTPKERPQVVGFKMEGVIVNVSG